MKEVPIPKLLPGRTYLFFSHTIKAQPQGMPLLDALLEKNVRLIDYECITEGGKRGGKRLVRSAVAHESAMSTHLLRCHGDSDKVLIVTIA